MFKNDDLIRKTNYGLVKGTENEFAKMFLNIPFAKPPVGELMFKHPLPPEKWEGIRDATKGGKNPVQHLGNFGIPNQSLDCLYLNVFTPKEFDKPLPVMFWIYGGAYSNGGVGVVNENEEPLTLQHDKSYVQNELYYDMSMFAEETKTIVVTFNYRINIYGFMNFNFLDESFDLNNGLMDQLMALRFTKENIEYFGGDKNNITIFGQSAGGSSVMSLMSLEESQGLFNKAIVESPCIDHYFTLEESQKLTQRFLKVGHIKDLKELYTIPQDKLYKVIQNVLDWLLLIKGDMRCYFSPIIDGKILKDYPIRAITTSNVPMLIGYTSNECDLFMDEYPAFSLPLIAAKTNTKVPKGEETYRHRLSDAITEKVYITPIKEALENYQGPSYLYEFAYSVPPKRAYHAIEVVLFVTEKEDKGAKAIRKIFSDFAYTSNPGWNEYKPNKEYFVIK